MSAVGWCGRGAPGGALRGTPRRRPQPRAPKRFRKEEIPSITALPGHAIHPSWQLAVSPCDQYVSY